MHGMNNMEQNLKMLVNGKELGITQIRMKACMNLSKESRGQQGTMQEF